MKPENDEEGKREEKQGKKKTPRRSKQQKREKDTSRNLQKKEKRKTTRELVTFNAFSCQQIKHEIKNKLTSSCTTLLTSSRTVARLMYGSFVSDSMTRTFDGAGVDFACVVSDFCSEADAEEEFARVAARRTKEIRDALVCVRAQRNATARCMNELIRMLGIVWVTLTVRFLFFSLRLRRKSKVETAFSRFRSNFRPIISWSNLRNVTTRTQIDDSSWLSRSR